MEFNFPNKYTLTSSELPKLTGVDCLIYEQLSFTIWNVRSVVIQSLWFNYCVYENWIRNFQSWHWLAVFITILFSHICQGFVRYESITNIHFNAISVHSCTLANQCHMDNYISSTSDCQPNSDFIHLTPYITSFYHKNIALEIPSRQICW